MRQNGNDEDDLVRWMKKHKILVTRKNYLELAYPDGYPGGAELEMALPEFLRLKKYQTVKISKNPDVMRLELLRN
jgi:hypothetical protein